MMARVIQRLVIASRWLLAPFFVILMLSLFAVLAKTVQQAVGFASHFLDATEAQVILESLSIVDLTLTGSLIIIVIFSGYENFVARIDDRGGVTWPAWLGKIDFTGLKLKLMSSIVAISGVQVLRNFMDLSEIGDRELAWTVGLHLAFVASALLLALTDRMSAHDRGPRLDDGHHAGANGDRRDRTATSTGSAASGDATPNGYASGDPRERTI